MTLDNVTKLLTKWENKKWIGSANKNILILLMAILHKRKGLTLLEKVKDHAEIEENEEADLLANQGI